MTYSISNRLRFDETQELIKALDENGIFAYFTSGGVSMEPEDDAVDTMFEIVRRFTNEVPVQGSPSSQESISFGVKGTAFERK